MPNRYDGLQLKILESTLEIVGELGLENLTIRKVSNHADVSVGIVHHHFDNKANLVYKTYDHLIRIAREQMTEMRADTPDPVERLKRTAELCFIPELTTKGAANVWPQMWSNSVYDVRVKRLCTIFSRRLISNLMYDFVAAGNRRELARIYATQTSALIHGLWVEQSILDTISVNEAMGMLNSNIDSFTGQIWLQR